MSILVGVPQVLVDESNVGSSVRTAGRGLDWLKLRDFLAGPATGRELIEMVVYAGLPPAMSIWRQSGCSAPAQPEPVPSEVRTVTV